MARIAELEATITAETGGFERGLSNVEKAIAGTRSTIGGLDRDINLMGRNMGSANDAMRAMGVSLPITPMAALGSAVGFVGSQMQSAINGTVEYAKQVRDLGRTIGATAEETSMLIQAADDVKVSYGSLSSALEAAIRKGVEPSIEGIGELADEYRSIQDPIAKTKFLMDNFGRSGADLAPMMELGAAGIRELGESARATGLVMSEEAVQAAREYEKAVEELTDAWQGFTVQVGTETIPMLTQLFKSFDKGHGAAKVMGTTVDEIAEKLEPHNRGLAAASAMVDMMTGSQTDGAAAARVLTGAYDSSRQAAMKLGRAIEDDLSGALALAARNTAELLDAGLAGRLQDAQQEYADVIADTTPEIARLTEQIARYQRQQGTSVTVTGEATTTINEYELGALKAAQAAQKLAEFTGDDALELAQLRVNADHAQEAVTKLGEGMGWSATTTADFTKAIAEDSAAMAELVKQQEEAEAALRKATAEMVLQQVAANLGVDASVEFAFATGLMSEADYNLTKAIQAATAAADLDRSGTIDSTAERDKLLAMTLKLTDQTGDLATGTYTAAQNMSDLDARLPPVATGLDKVTTSAGLARDGIEQIPHAVPLDTTPAISALANASREASAFGLALANIPRSVTVDIITNNHTNYSGYQIPGTGGNAAGADFIVPPGFPNDSYMMNVQSGEHVTVIPAGGSGTGNGGGSGNTYNFNFQNAAPVTVPNALQTARAVSGGLY